MDLALMHEGEPLLAIALALIAVGVATLAWLVRKVLVLARELDRLARGRAAPSGATGQPGGLCGHVLDRLPTPVVVQDGAGRTVLANQAWSRLSEAGPGAASATPDTPHESADGTRWLSWVETPIEFDGQPCRVRSGHDVTERVKAARALEAARAEAERDSDAKSRVLATVTHEFRTPLNGILGMTGLLLETDLDAEQTTYVQAVQSSAETFRSLVDDILDFSRIKAGRIDLSDEPFDLPALVQGVVELLAPRAQGKGTEIACFIGRDVPRTVRGDPDRLRQVLLNLAGNAVKFTACGGAGITVERGPGDRISLCVADTGPGIPPERAARVFEEFEQGGDAAEAGTGLGLAITRRLVEGMRGRIELDSVPGSGSRFRVELDLPVAPDASRPAELPAIGARRVLILCGAPFEGPYLARTLAQAGLEAAVVRTLDAALARMATEPFDAVIVDQALPGADVRLVSREARRHGIGRSIVLLSPFERRDFGSPHAAGFDAYLVKPVRARSLFERLAARPPVTRPARPANMRPNAATERRRAHRVLLAEDDEVNALLAVRSLERLGAVVDWAKDGHAALARAEESLRDDAAPFDLILMDVRMPGLDGYEVTRRIRRRETETRAGSRSRIVALTASVVGDRDMVLQEAGFDALMVKPFAYDSLALELGKSSDVLAIAS